MLPTPRPLSVADAGALHSILIACGDGLRLSSWGLPIWSVAALEDALQRHFGWALDDDQGVVAFILLQNLPDAWEILHLATAPRARRRGCMRTLLRCVIDSLQAEQKLWLEVHEGNLPARRLYESIGFREIGRRPRYYSGGGSAVLYNLG